jgi:hypothetical protein
MKIKNGSLYPFAIFVTLVLSSPTGLTFANQVLAQTSLHMFNNSIYGGGFVTRFEVDNMIPVVEFISPDCSVSVSLGLEKLLKKTTLDQLTNESISSIKKNQTGLRVIESANATLAGIPAHKLVFNGKFDIAGAINRTGLGPLIGNMLKSKSVNGTTMQITALHDGNAYFLAYSDYTGKILNQELGDLSGGLGDLSGGLGDLSGGLGDLSGGLDGFPCNIAAVHAGSTSSLQDRYSQYLPTVQQMFDSFQIGSLGTNNSAVISSTQCTDLVGKLNSRLVNGEIASQQYDEIRKKIGC